MLEVYTWEPNANSGKPLLALKEKGVPFTYHYIDMGKRQQHSPEYLRINPNGTVPAVVHDGLVMTESTPALEYIDEVFDGPALRPRDPYRLWRMRRWARYMDEHLCPSLAMLGGNAASQRIQSSEAETRRAVEAIPLPERRRVWELILSRRVPEAEIAESNRRISAGIRTLEAALAEFPYLAGESYSLADIIAMATLYALPLQRPDEANAERTPHLMDWLRRCHQRPALQEAFALGTGWIAGRVREMRELLGLAA